MANRLANRFRGEAEFEHDGQSHALLITMEVLLLVEEETGVNILALDEGFTPNLGWLSSILRHALHAAQKPGIAAALMPREDAAAMLFGSPLVRAAVLAAINDAFPTPEVDVGKAPSSAKRKRGAGTTS
jgi:hypothetical protein